MTHLHHALLLVAAFLAVFLQSACQGLRLWVGAQVDLLPPLMVYAGLGRRVAPMVTLATVGGLWFDCLSANPLGTSVLPLLAIGLVVHHYRTLLMRNERVAQFILGLAASALSPLLALVLLTTFGNPPLTGLDWLWPWAVMTVGGGAATPLVFRFFDWANQALNYQPVKQSSFRPDRIICRGPAPQKE